MRFIDLHQDLQPHLASQPGPRVQTDWHTLTTAGARAVVASTFPLRRRGEELGGKGMLQRVDEHFAAYAAHCLADPGWHLVRDAHDLDAAVELTGASRGLLLAVEGFAPLPAKPWGILEQWWTQGWRVGGPMWNGVSILGGGTGSADGLTQAGRDVVEWCLRRGVILDFAHMGRRTFHEAAALCDGLPILVSHANARAVHDHPRNLDDAQLNAVRASGGLVGVTFVPEFVGAGDQVGFEDILRQLDHLLSRLGQDGVAVGTDFGGISGRMVGGLERVDAVAALWARLRRHGYDDGLVEAIAWRNAFRFLRGALPGASPLRT